MIIVHEVFDYPYKIVDYLNAQHRKGWVIKQFQVIVRPSFTGDEWHCFAVLDKAGAT